MSKKEAIYRLIGYAFFPIQLFVVWVIFFGFNLEPNILQFSIGIGADKIAMAVARFVVSLPFKAFTSAKLLAFVFSLLPNLLLIAFSLWRVALLTFAVWQFLQFVIAQISIVCGHIKSVIESVRVIVKIGGPGSGKSSSGVYEAVKKAQKAYKNLCWYYWHYSGKAAKWKEQNNTEKLERWQEVKEAFEFYETHLDCVPCLWSNIPLENLCGLKANKLTLDHLYQRKRLPSFAVLFIDEVGQMLGLDLSVDKVFDVSDFFRCCRHFGEFYVICTEQSAENIYIDVRRVVGFNQYMQNQAWVCKPYALLFFFNLFKALFTYLQRGAARFSPAMSVVNDLIKHIGFRKYAYSFERNTERKRGMFSDKGVHTFYLPSALNCDYDERTFRKFYKCKDKPLSADIFKSLTLKTFDENGAVYLRDKARETAEKEQKKIELQAVAKAIMKDKKKNETAAKILGQFGARDKLVNGMTADEAIETVLKFVAESESITDEEIT